MKAASSSTPEKQLDKSLSIAMMTAYAEPSGTANEYAVEVAGDTTDDGIAIREGAWETTLFCCLAVNFGALLNGVVGWCLPFVTIAQVAQRMGIANYWLVLLVILVLYGAERIVDHYARWDRQMSSYLWLLADFTINKVYTAATSEELHSENIYLQDTALGIHFGHGMWAFIGIVPGLAMAVATWGLRTRVRTRFHIPGSCYIDGLVACFCSCCAVAQMAIHLKVPEKCGCNMGPVDTLPAFPQ